MTPQEQWQRDGYAMLPGVLDSQAIADLYETCEHAFAQWQQTSNEDNQPGGFCYGPSAWVLIHVNHPGYYDGRRELLTRLLNAIATPAAIDLISDIFGEPALFEQANYYIDPPEIPASQGGAWHRDCQFFAGGDHELEKKLFTEEADPPRELHMHIPLVPTSATGVVPGSHKRWDTPEEVCVRRNTPHGDMPGGIRLPMEPGDLGFFHVNSIHRGYYEVGVPRRTIAVTFSAQSGHRPFDPARWQSSRGYIAPFQPWFAAPDYLEGCEPHAARLFERFIDRYSDQWTDENINPQAIGQARADFYAVDAR